MSTIKKSTTTTDAKRRYNGFLALCIITTILLTSVIAAGIQTTPQVTSASSSLNHRASGSGILDPNATIYGYHLYDVRNWYIPSAGQNFTLNFPPNWTVANLGFDFFNGTLQNMQYVNETTVSTALVTQAGGQYYVTINNLKVPKNSTVYQAMFNITRPTIMDSSSFVTVNGVSNSDYPVIDGNVGLAQRFSISVYAVNLSFQVNLFRFDGTAGNLTAEVRRSTYDNMIGELVKSVSIPSTTVSLGSTWVTINVPQVNLSTGYYFLVLHTDGWSSSGGGYLAGTTLSTQLTSPPLGWVTSNKGVNWQNQVTIAGSAYYFNGFNLKVHVASPPVTSTNINLRIDGIPVSNNFIWNQSVWNNAPPYSFLVTSDYPIPVLNFTYKVWYYSYGDDNLFRNGYHIKVNTNKTTTASSTGNFTLMRVTLGQSDLLGQGVLNRTAGILTINLKLFNGSSTQIGGSVNVTAWVELTREVDGLTFTGPYSLVLNFIYNHPTGSDYNVTLSETALVVLPINNQVDNVYVNEEIEGGNRWIYANTLNTLGVFREAFTSLPQFTLLSGSNLNCTVTVLNNFTAAATITDYLSDTTPTATIRVQNTTPLVDLDGLTQVNITVTDPNGLLINNTELPLGGPYKFNLTVTGEGIYGIMFISKDSIGQMATRWIGAATVNDITLAAPTVTLTPASNLTSQQTVLIFANASYTDHPEILFNGNLTITIYVGDTGAVTQLQATWNGTLKLYQAAYQAPLVDSITQLTIRVQACDSKNRISTSFASAYVTPPPPITPPPVEPSIVAIVILAIIALLVLVPALAYLVEKHRKE